MTISTRALAAALTASCLLVAAGCGGGGGNGGGSDKTITVPIAGTITDAATGSPIEGARVSVPGSAAAAATAADGSFRLDVEVKASAASVGLAAGKEGYFNLGFVAPTNGQPVAASLATIPALDQPTYNFIGPNPLLPGHPNPGMACAYCHTETYFDWLSSPHATAATNPRVLDAYVNDFKLRFNELGIDTCASCHAPGLAVHSQRADHADAPITAASGSDAEGVHCDVCHKIDAASASTPFPGGAYGDLRFLRPEGAFDRSRDNLGVMFGPLTNSTYPFMRATPTPVEETSEVCSACHESKNVLGLAAEETYSQWQSSSARDEGKTCQSCHMPADTGRTSLVTDTLQALGPKRDTSTIHDHRIVGPTASLLASAADVRLVATTDSAAGTIDVTVGIENTFAGHSLPSGFPSRQVLLVVHAIDSAGGALETIGGDVLGDEAGSGDPGDTADDLLKKGDFAGFPGRVYERNTLGLNAEGSDVEDLTPPWRAVNIVSDTRIPAGGSDSAAFRFRAPAAGLTARIEVRLVHRRAPKTRFDWSALVDRPFDIDFFDETIDGDGNVLDTTPPASSASPTGALYTSPISVALSANEPATIYYTTDDTPPTVESLIYDAPIPVSSFLRLRFFAVDTAGNAEPGSHEEVYVVRSGGPVTLSRDVQPILTRSCALSIGCHTGLTPPAGMNLSAGLAFSNTVSVRSAEVPTLFRIKPFESASSYLIYKITGTAGDVGGVPSRMPLGFPPLPPDEISTIREWIDEGAMEN